MQIIREEDDVINSLLNKLNLNKLKKEEEVSDNINQEEINKKNIFNFKSKWKNLIENLLLKKKNIKEKENEIINDINQFQILKILKIKLFLIKILVKI